MLRRLLTNGAPNTLFGTGAPGAPLRHPVNVVINDIWLLDDVYHGASQDLNAGRLAGVHSWVDFSRDILNFVQHALPGVAGREAPYQLAWEECTHVVPGVVGVGHSFGAGAQVLAINEAPERFEALFMVEPMIRPAKRKVRWGDFRRRSGGVWPHTQRRSTDDPDQLTIGSSGDPGAVATRVLGLRIDWQSPRSKPVSTAMPSNPTTVSQTR